jgi:hypothetical protein
MPDTLNPFHALSEAILTLSMLSAAIALWSIVSTLREASAALYDLLDELLDEMLDEMLVEKLPDEGILWTQGHWWAAIGGEARGPFDTQAEAQTYLRDFGGK